MFTGTLTGCHNELHAINSDTTQGNVMIGNGRMDRREEQNDGGDKEK